MTKKDNSTLKEEDLVLSMPLEEALKIVKPLQNPIFKEEKLFNAINTLVNLAKWYNSQDLIKREDINEAFTHRLAEKLDDAVKSIVSKIPKAKPELGHIIIVDKKTYDAIINSKIPNHTKLIEEVKSQEEAILKERAIDEKET